MKRKTKKEKQEELSKAQKIRLKAKEKAKKLNNEIRKAVTTAIVAAFGFIIALTWRDVITEYVNKITALSPVSGKLITAIIVTIVAVIGIIIVTKFNVEEERN